MKRFVAAVFGLLCMAISHPANAALWTTECNDQRCGFSIAITENASQKKLVVFTVLSPKNTDSPSVLIVTPLGAALEPGARILFGQEELVLIFKVCLNDGCRAFADVTDNQLDKLVAAKMIEVRFFAQTQPAPYSVKFATDGLAEAIAAARKP